MTNCPRPSPRHVKMVRLKEISHPSFSPREWRYSTSQMLKRFMVGAMAMSMPYFFKSLIPFSARQNAPFIPRRKSWTFSDQSILTCTESIPTSRILRAESSVIFKPFVERNKTLNFSRHIVAISKKSGFRSGSPPENAIIRTSNSSIWAIAFFASGKEKLRHFPDPELE